MTVNSDLEMYPRKRARLTPARADLRGTSKRPATFLSSTEFPRGCLLNTSHRKYFEKKEFYSGQGWKMLDKALYTLSHIFV